MDSPGKRLQAAAVTLFVSNCRQNWYAIRKSTVSPSGIGARFGCFGPLAALLSVLKTPPIFRVSIPSSASNDSGMKSSDCIPQATQIIFPAKSYGVCAIRIAY